MNGKDWLSRLLLGSRSIRKNPTRWQMFASAFVQMSLGIIFTLLLAMTLSHLLHVSANLLLFFPIVVVAAVRYGFFSALLTTVSSVLVTSFMLAEPRYSFGVADMETLWSMMVFILAAAIVSSLAARVREQSLAIQTKNAVTETLYAFSARLSGVADFRDLTDLFSKEVGRILQVDATILRVDEGTSEPGLEGAQRDEIAANQRESSSAPREVAEEIRVPLVSRGECRAVAHVHRRRDSQPLSTDDHRLLLAVVSQCVVVLERLDLADRLRDARVEAETDRMRAALLSAVSHDLKTPLATILGNISGLRRYASLYDADTRLDMLVAAETATERLGTFVENLLDMTRIDADSVVGKIEKLDLADVVGAAMKSAQRLLVRHWVRVDLPPELPMVDADDVLLDHVLVNLLDNAAKYSPEGSLITISATQNQDEIGLHVTDEGPGIPEQDLERIFNRFFRVSRSQETASGSGLGLAICRSFAQVMGARVAATNRADASGATFTVWFPTAAQERTA